VDFRRGRHRYSVRYVPAGPPPEMAVAPPEPLAGPAYQPQPVYRPQPRRREMGIGTAIVIAACILVMEPLLIWASWLAFSWFIYQDVKSEIHDSQERIERSLFD